MLSAASQQLYKHSSTQEINSSTILLKQFKALIKPNAMNADFLATIIFNFIHAFTKQF